MKYAPIKDEITFDDLSKTCHVVTASHVVNLMLDLNGEKVVNT